MVSQARSHFAAAPGRWLRDSHGLEAFGVRVGVHAGSVLRGGVQATRTAMGHAVKLAARLERTAPQGRLRIGRETWVQVHRLFRVEPPPPLLVKGDDEPLVSDLIEGVLPDAVLAPVQGDGRPHFMALQPLAMRAGHAVFAAAGGPAADALHAASRARLASFPVGDAGRTRLLRQARARRGMAAPA